MSQIYICKYNMLNHTIFCMHSYDIENEYEDVYTYYENNCAYVINKNKIKNSYISGNTLIYADICNTEREKINATNKFIGIIKYMQKTNND